MKEVYRVWFDDPQGNRRCVDVPRSLGVQDPARGVWVTSDFGSLETVLVPVGSHWVPPSRLVLITKLDLEDAADA